MMSSTLFRGLSPKSLHMLEFFINNFFPLHTEMWCRWCVISVPQLSLNSILIQKLLFSIPPPPPISLIGQTDNSTINSLHWLSWCSWSWCSGEQCFFFFCESTFKLIVAYQSVGEKYFMYQTLHSSPLIISVFHHCLKHGVLRRSVVMQSLWLLIQTYD